MKRVLRLFLFTVFALMLGILIAGTVLSYRQAEFLVNPPQYNAPAHLKPNTAQDVDFISADGFTLRGWYVPPTHPTSGAAILFIHGHAGNRSQFVREAALYIEQGYGLLLFDLRNHGASDPAPTTMGLNEVLDVQAAFDFLAAQPSVDGERIALYGHSMGAATAIRAMARIPQARALVASAPYSSMERVLNDGVRTLTFGLLAFPFGSLTQTFTSNLSDANVREVRPIDDIAGIAPRPVLIMHGTADAIIPFAHSERLFAAAGEPKQFFAVDDAGHNSIYIVAPDAYAERVPPFLEAALRD